MLRSELKSEELLASELNMEKERMRIELRAPPRVTLVEPPELPWTRPTGRCGYVDGHCDAGDVLLPRGGRDDPAGLARLSKRADG